MTPEARTALVVKLEELAAQIVDYTARVAAEGYRGEGIRWRPPVLSLDARELARLEGVEAMLRADLTRADRVAELIADPAELERTRLEAWRIYNPIAAPPAGWPGGDLPLEQLVEDNLDAMARHAARNAPVHRLR